MTCIVFVRTWKSAQRHSAFIVCSCGRKGVALKMMRDAERMCFFLLLFFRCCVSDRRAFNLIYLYACAHSLNKIYHKINAHDIAEIFFSPNCVSGPYYYLCMRLSHRIDILCSKTKKTKNFIFF